MRQLRHEAKQVPELCTMTGDMLSKLDHVKERFGEPVRLRVHENGKIAHVRGYAGVRLIEGTAILSHEPEELHEN